MFSAEHVVALGFATALVFAEAGVKARAEAIAAIIKAFIGTSLRTKHQRSAGCRNTRRTPIRFQKAIFFCAATQRGSGQHSVAGARVRLPQLAALPGAAGPFCRLPDRQRPKNLFQTTCTLIAELRRGGTT